MEQSLARRSRLSRSADLLSSARSGFSLVELSIVLVILGLLTGGILTGQNLIRAAELRAVTTEAQTYLTSIRTFQGKYFAMPGDITNATAFWGAPGGNIANCPATAGTGTETCNGDGNGEITASGSNRYAEPFTAWQHLANAGLIEGTYTGRVAAPSTSYIAGGNAPASRISSGVWGLETMHDNNGNGYRFNMDYGTMLMFGVVNGTTRPYGDVLTPTEAWGIDKKMDDGLPAQGRVILFNLTDCAVNIDDVNDHVGEYNLASDGKDCGLYFLFR
jgi:prepilin-type N-terminal cleavage/methylation domain-containing protein